MFKNVNLKYIQLLKFTYKDIVVIPCRTLTGLQLWEEELSQDLKYKIEKHWSSKLTFSQYQQNSKREKYYVLPMFPYPSGNLHMGHVRVYTISDTVARFQRMNNKNVIHPIGWDAFGLPAENAARDRNVAPDEWTKINIEHMKTRLQQLACTFEWERELTTCNNSYYKWTQELFLKLYDEGFAYQKEAYVNWDPIDQTVLADEQVDEDLCSWRSGGKVERKLLRQWFIRTTRFAQDLYNGLDDPVLENWRDITKIQKHWIGECNGVAFDFPIVSQPDFVQLWTLYPEYMDCSKFVALSSSHLLSKCEGIDLAPGTKCINLKVKNPISGDDLPVFVTDQVEYLDSSDSHLGIPLASEQDQRFCDNFNINYELHNMLSTDEINEKRLAICTKAQSLGVGGYWTSAKLRDWLISRQRYWGTPIPVVHCKDCGVVPVPRIDLPVQLPKLSKSGRLADAVDWLNTTCPSCKGAAKRETDTMDTFVDSSWYYLRYLDVNNRECMFDVNKAKEMAPVDLYIGGKEHATLHLYYARFVSHFLYMLGLVPQKEPFKRLLVQGMVMGQSFRIKGTGQYVPNTEVEIVDLKRNKAVHKDTSRDVVISWEKMSKSKHNGVDPLEMVKEYGVDTTRLLVLADVAPTSHRNWNSNTFPGVLNWQKRLWLTVQEFIKFRQSLPPVLNDDQLKKHEDFLFDSRNYYVKSANFNYSVAYQFNVVISKMQGLTNSLRKVPGAAFAHSLQFERALASELIIIAPMAPHFASELWSGFISAPNRLSNNVEIQWDKSVFEQKWPEVDKEYKLDLICQINGEEYCIVKIPKPNFESLSSDDVLNIAMEQKEIKEILHRRPMINFKYTFHAGYQGVINIFAAKSSSQEVVAN